MIEFHLGRRLILVMASTVMAIFFVGCKSYPDKKMNKLTKLVGTWENQQKEENTVHTEKWTVLDDSSMVGIGLLMRLKDTVFMEMLKISKIDSNWYYIAEVSENPLPVFFKMDSITNKGFTAINPNHDFPKRIEYRRKGKSLHAEVSDGGSKKINFEFKKVKP